MRITSEDLKEAISELENSNLKSSKIAIIYLKKELARRRNSGRPSTSPLSRKEQISEAVKRHRLKKKSKESENTEIQMKQLLREANFIIETFPGEVFRGFTLNEDWNGWACPYFETDEAKRILGIYNNIGGDAKYDEPNDTFIFSDGEEIFSITEIEGIKLYPIGNSHWIWEEASNN